MIYGRIILKMEVYLGVSNAADGLSKRNVINPVMSASVDEELFGALSSEQDTCTTHKIGPQKRS